MTAAPLPLPASARPVRLLGTGVALPERVVTSAELDGELGLAPGTVERRTGVVRRHVEEARSAAQLGAVAARQALAAAGLGLGEIDCLVAASGTPDQAMPCNAALLHQELGFPVPIPAFDVNASCLSFLVALDTVACLIPMGRYRRVLIVSVDIASCGLDWNHLEASGIFGDGAAAAVVGPAGASGSALLAAAFRTYSEGAHYCEIPGGGSRFHPSRIDEEFLPLARFRMDGPAVFRLAGSRLPELVAELLAGAGLALAEIPVVVPHQASDHALQFLRRRLRLRREQVVDIYADHGNQVAASLPTALHAAITSGRLQRGQPALLVGSGAGVSLGGVVMVY